MRFSIAAILALALAVAIPPAAEAYLINEWEPIEIAGASREEATKIEEGKDWREPLSGMQFIWVQGGCYSIGSPPRIEGRDADEGPVREVCVSGFWIGKREVTQGEWRKVMRSNPSHFRKGDEYPLERVAWIDAEAFIRKLNEIYPGEIPFRMPTEAEWEYACRNRGQMIRYSGAADPSEVGWFLENSGMNTQAVATRAPNRQGLFDMSGNVWEWTKDSYMGHAYEKMKRDDPTVENTSIYKVIRGGAWSSEGRSLRCSNRGFELFSTKRNDIGLRMVRVVDTSVKERIDLRNLTPF